MRKVIAVATKELRQILRDRRTLLILLFIPAFFLLLYGYALNFDIRNVSILVKDQDRSTKSRELVSAFINSGYFNLIGYVDSDREIDRLIDMIGAVRSARAEVGISPGVKLTANVADPQDITVLLAYKYAAPLERLGRIERFDSNPLDVPHGARIEPPHNSHEADPGLLFAARDCRLNRRGSPVLGEQ